MVCNPTKALENYSEIPTPDLIHICVKSYDLDATLDEIPKNMTGRKNIIISEDICTPNNNLNIILNIILWN
jgi:ketopantoate reductase